VLSREKHSSRLPRQQNESPAEFARAYLTKGVWLATRAAVVALWIALLIRLAIAIFVLLSVAIAGAVVVVRVFISLLLRGTEAVPGLTIGSAVIHAILITYLLGGISAAVPITVSRVIGAVSGRILAVPIPVTSEVVVISLVVS